MTYSENAVYDTVLVDVPQSVELFECPRSVRSLVRLRPIEDCPGVVGYTAPEPMVGEFGRVVEERPVDRSGDVVLPQVLDGIRAAREQPSGLVERGSKVVKEVA